MINTLKYKRNVLLLKIMEIQDKVLKLRLIYIYRLINFNNNKRQVLNEITELEKLQLFNYEYMNEYDINTKTNYLNTLEPDVEQLEKEINSSENEINDLYNNMKSIDDLLCQYYKINENKIE